jgi:hypothetical protein
MRHEMRREHLAAYIVPLGKYISDKLNSFWWRFIILYSTVRIHMELYLQRDRENIKFNWISIFNGQQGERSYK